MGTTISFKRPDGQDVNGYLAEPAGAGLVLLLVRPLARRAAAADSAPLLEDRGVWPPSSTS